MTAQSQLIWKESKHLSVMKHLKLFGKFSQIEIKNRKKHNKNKSGPKIGKQKFKGGTEIKLQNLSEPQKVRRKKTTKPKRRRREKI